jgi:adenylate kinase
MKAEGTRRIILITGTPAVGKTTVSSILASRLDAMHINLTDLAKQERLTNGVDRERNTLIVNIDDMSKRVKELIVASGQDCIIDGHYAVDTVPPEDVDFVFVLRRSPDELKKMMENRGYGEKKLQENLEAEILDICLWEAVSSCGRDKVCEIDTTGKAVEDLVSEVVQTLQGKVRCRVGIVDWLGQLEGEGRLSDFLTIS